MNWTIARMVQMVAVMLAIAGFGFAASTAMAQVQTQAPPSAPARTAPQPIPQITTAPQAPDRQAAPAVTLSEGYVLGPGDVIEVSIPGREDFQSRVQVQADGTILLPFLNSVNAGGQTVLQLRQTIANALQSGGFYANPAVNVIVVTYASRYVVVLGEVATPGIVPIDRAYRVSEILARVGGVKDSAANNLTLRRASGEEIKLPIREVAMGGPNEDPVVNPGDKVFVPATETFYIYGQVTAPGTYPVDDAMTLRMALARGGGLTDRGSEKRVKVYREGREIEVEPNGRIEGGDVVVIGERFF